MAEKNGVREEEKNTFFKISLAECILVLILILSIVLTKFFFVGTYKKAKKWYVENVTADTNVSRIIDGAKDEN